jgi:hypothetical protein
VSVAAYETSFVSIVLMLCAMGLGSEAIRPMAAPVLRGLPAADEVIDCFLSALYFAVSKKTTGENSALETRSARVLWTRHAIASVKKSSVLDSDHQDRDVVPEISTPHETARGVRPMA